MIQFLLGVLVGLILMGIITAPLLSISRSQRDFLMEELNVMASSYPITKGG